MFIKLIVRPSVIAKIELLGSETFLNCISSFVWKLVSSSLEKWSIWMSDLRRGCNTHLLLGIFHSPRNSYTAMVRRKRLPLMCTGDCWHVWKGTIVCRKYAVVMLFSEILQNGWIDVELKMEMKMFFCKWLSVEGYTA